MRQNSGTLNECSQNFPMSTPVTFIGEYPKGGGGGGGGGGAAKG